MGKIPADCQAVAVCVLGDGGYVEELAGVVLDPGKKDEGGCRSVLGDDAADVFCRYVRELWIRRLDCDKGGRGYVVMLEL